MSLENASRTRASERRRQGQMASTGGFASSAASGGFAGGSGLFPPIESGANEICVLEHHIERQFMREYEEIVNMPTIYMYNKYNILYVYMYICMYICL